MIRVMVVEDEPPIAKSIALLAEQYGRGVQVAYTAINGRRALEYLEREPVDLVFSDIKMPIMDGLELARHVSEDYPGVTMVIISGFQEFEFARTAIRYGVKNYLLKPISREALHEVLDNACAEILARQEQEVRRLLERAVSSEEPAAAERGGEPCGVLLACAGPYPLTPEELPLASRDLWCGTDPEQELRRLLPEDSICIGTGGRSLSERALVFGAEDEAQIRPVAQRLFDRLTGLGLCVTLAASGQPVPLSGAGDILHGLRKQLYREIRLFTPALVWSGQERDGNRADAAAQVKEVIRALQSGNPDSIRRTLGELVSVFAAKQARQTELVICLEKLAMNFFDGRLELPQIGDLKYELQSAISTAHAPKELADGLAQVFAYWVRPEHQADKGELGGLCEQAAEYIRLNYSGNITTAALSRQFGYSSTQLAKKFKEHFGVSISEYVNSYRVQLAQALMRSDRQLMIKEIALEVGYNDQYYFSKIFKKITGIWPTEYQREESTSK